MLHSHAFSVGHLSTNGAPTGQEMRLLSIVIPALNEAENIPRVMATIPLAAFEKAGWDVEFVVVDNGSVDGTGHIAAAHNARVVRRSVRGYGSAYRAGLAAARGDLIVTGDADCTYPFDAVPELLEHFESQQLDFLSTNRLGTKDRQAMKRSHMYANHALTGLSRTLFRSPFRDSQSGMWIFRREILDHLDLRSNGMAFSQEIKHEAYLKGFRCDEVAIEYRVRGGSVKLNAWRDGVVNTSQLFSHRVRGRRLPAWGALTEVGTTVVANTDLADVATRSTSMMKDLTETVVIEQPAELLQPTLVLAPKPEASPKSFDASGDCEEMAL
jgi:glycosyltransferase involved in cell wall biosynthesis